MGREWSEPDEAVGERRNYAPASPWVDVDRWKPCPECQHTLTSHSSTGCQACVCAVERYNESSKDGGKA